MDKLAEMPFNQRVRAINYEVLPFLRVLNA